jgi:uncharacterized repeat protein (TIGR04138 family)
MPMRHAGISEVIRQEILTKDPRYQLEAYEFTLDACQHTQRLLGRKPERDPLEESPANHLTARQLLEGMCDLAQQQFGLLARTVLARWGVNCTDDFGEIVYNLINAELLSKSAEDTKADFHNVFDLDQALKGGFEIKLEEME